MFTPVLHAESVRRLRVLSAFLLTVPEENFHLNSWASAENTLQELEQHACGTTACAVGWAATIPEFKALGLELHIHPEVSYPSFSGFEGMFAAQKFFGIPVETCDYLFLASRYFYGTTQNVSKRIDKVIKSLVAIEASYDR